MKTVWDLSSVSSAQLQQRHNHHNIHSTVLSCKHQTSQYCNGLTLDNWQTTPLNLAPSHADQPLLNFLDQLSQVLRIRFQDLVEYSKFAGPEENLRQAKLEVYFVQAKRFEQSLQRNHNHTGSSNTTSINKYVERSTQLNKSNNQTSMYHTLQNSLGSRRAMFGGMYFLYMLYSSANCVRDG